MNTLQDYKKNITSQWGEDGVIDEIFRRIGVTEKFCIEFGAWDGKHYSNTWHLWHDQKWSALLIEGDRSKCDELARSVSSFHKVIPHCAYVEANGEQSLDKILGHLSLSKTIDLLSIDIDGDDYYIFKSLQARPRVIVIEYNPTVPPHLNLIQEPGEYLGASARAIYELAHTKGYRLAALTETNLFFVCEEEFSQLGIEEPLLTEIFIPAMLTYVITSYDGVPFLTKNPTYASLHIHPMKDRHFAGPQTLIPVFIQRKGIRLGVLRSYVKGTFAFIIKPFLKKTFLYHSYRTMRTAWINLQNQLKHRSKEAVLNKYRRRFKIKILVETGTYLGDMVNAMQDKFEKIYSIELSHELAVQAKQKFSTTSHISILEGDSAVILPKILQKISSPALFWLDGHYSGGITARGSQATPIEQELRAIFASSVRGHVVLIDDARLFDGTDCYPTIEDIKKKVSSLAPDYRFSISNDIIILSPNRH